MPETDIYSKFASLPDNLKKEVEDFIDFLKSKVPDSNSIKPQRKAGLAKGLIQMKEDFDEPLDDFKEYME